MRLTYKEVGHVNLTRTERRHRHAIWLLNQIARVRNRPVAEVAVEILENAGGDLARQLGISVTGSVG